MLFRKFKDLFKNSLSPDQSVKALQQDNVKQKKQIDGLLKDKASNLKFELKNKVELINDINFLAAEINLDQSTIKDLAFQLGSEFDNLFFISGSNIDNKPMLTVYISKNIVSDKLNAGIIVRELGKLIQGGGGGQPFYATAGGKNPKGIKDALLKARDYVLVYESEDDIKNIEIDRQIFDKINLDPGGVVVTSKGSDCDFVSRFFTPQASILEDPVTGSAHCSLIPYWSERLNKKVMHAKQLSNRGGTLFCINHLERVLISGKAKTYSIGSIWI